MLQIKVQILRGLIAGRSMRVLSSPNVQTSVGTNTVSASQWVLKAFLAGKVVRECI
jgi:hypothetical protein